LIWYLYPINIVACFTTQMHGYIFG
jgi:hypothetical protein